MPHTKFQLNPTGGSGEEVENAKSLTDAGRRTDAGRTQDAGRRTTRDDISSPGPKGPGELKIKYKIIVRFTQPGE